MPSYTTAQASVMAVVYLICASRINTAHAALAAAVSIAQSLGVSLCSASTLGKSRRQSICQYLYLLDTMLGFDRGGRFLSNAMRLENHELQAFPSQGTDPASAMPKISDYYPITLELAMNARALQSALLNVYASQDGVVEMGAIKLTSQDVLSLEEANINMRQWILRVPSSLQLQRKGSGKPFSTRRLQLDQDTYAPFWLQRQRIFLELTFQHQMMLIYRDFIFLGSTGTASDPTTAGYGASSMLHASTITSIISQVLAESDLLSLWHGVYRMQRDAFFALATFATTHPLCPHAPTALTAMQTAVSTFQNLAERHDLGVNNDAAGAAERILGDVQRVHADLHRTIVISQPTNCRDPSIRGANDQMHQIQRTNVAELRDQESLIDMTSPEADALWQFLHPDAAWLT